MTPDLWVALVIGLATPASTIVAALIWHKRTDSSPSDDPPPGVDEV